MMNAIESAGRAPATEFRHHFATLLSASAPALERGGKTFHEIPVALTGKWMKRGQEFLITLADLRAMARNFAKRKNEQVVIDYEHASETPEVALGGPVPAAGWIHDLRIESSSHRDIGPLRKVNDSTTRSPHDSIGQSLNGPILTALVEWTPEARRMIHDGQYRFFSPAIDWNYRDKETGEPQGATLTSGALTNHPFLEELPPLMLTDLGGSAAVLDASSAQQPRAVRAPAPPKPAEGETPMKKLTLKPLTEEPLAGHHGVFDGEDSLGYLDSAEFADYARQHLENAADTDDADDGAEKACPSQKLAERIGVTPTTTFDELRRRLAVGAESEAASSRVVLLSEATRDGALDNPKAMELARAGRIALADYIAAQEADRALGEAVRAGKILPRERKFFFRDALERPREFADYLHHAAPRVPLGSVGLASGGPLGVDEEVRVRTESVMAEEKLSYSKALKRVFAGDHELAARYHSAHRRRLASDGGAENVVPGIST